MLVKLIYKLSIPLSAHWVTVDIFYVLWLVYVKIYMFALLGDKELIQEVLFDAVVTAPLEAYWTSLVLNKSECVTHSSLLFPCS